MDIREDSNSILYEHMSVVYSVHYPNIIPTILLRQQPNRYAKCAMHVGISCSCSQGDLHTNSFMPHFPSCPFKNRIRLRQRLELKFRRLPVSVRSMKKEAMEIQEEIGVLLEFMLLQLFIRDIFPIQCNFSILVFCEWAHFTVSVF